MAPPKFEDADTWDTWADKLMAWGLDQAKRRGDLNDWYLKHCTE